MTRRVASISQRGESFTFLGFNIRRAWTQRGKLGVACVPKIAARTKLLRRLKGVMRRHCSQPVERVIALINPILRGWTNYFRIGQSSRCFSHVKGLGREEGTATLDATARASGVRLEEVE